MKICDNSCLSYKITVMNIALDSGYMQLKRVAPVSTRVRANRGLKKGYMQYQKST